MLALINKNVNAKLFIGNTWKETMGLIRLTPENTIKYNYESRNQVYRWINDVEYTYGGNGRSKTMLHAVTCEETWKKTSRTTGKIEPKSARYVWISGKEITKSKQESFWRLVYYEKKTIKINKCLLYQ